MHVTELANSVMHTHTQPFCGHYTGQSFSVSTCS